MMTLFLIQQQRKVDRSGGSLIKHEKITYIYQTAVGSNIKIVRGLSFSAIKSKTEDNSYLTIKRRVRCPFFSTNKTSLLCFNNTVKSTNVSNLVYY